MRRPIPAKAAPRRVIKRPETGAETTGAAMTSNDSTIEEEVSPTPVASTPKKEKIEAPKQETPKVAPVSHSTEKEEKNKSLPVLLLGVIVILVGVAGYFVSEFIAAKNELDKKNSQLSAIEKSSDEKLAAQKQELEKMLAEYDEVKKERSKLGANNQELNAEIDALRNQLTRLNHALQVAKSENNNGTASTPKPSKASKLSTAEKEKYAQEMEALIATHKVALEERDKEIKKLKHINKHLSHQLNTLSEKHGQLVGNVSSLEERIAVASQLYIENLKVGYKTTKGTVEYDELDEFPAKKIEQIKIGFVIADNKIADKGFKNFKLKLTDPSGKVLFDSGKSGGSFDSKEGPQFYTSEKEVKFDNDKEEVNFFFVQSAEYKKGKYEAVIFADNKKVGEKRFSIK